MACSPHKSLQDPRTMKVVPVYKLLTEADWEASLGAGVTACALDLADGYVHLSTREQAEVTAARYFSGAGRIRLLRFPAGSLDPIRWEASRGGELFPHLYGALDVFRADAAWWLTPGPNGAPMFPAAY